MQIVDTHCQLTESPLIEDLRAVLRRARERAVTDVVVPAWNLESWPVVERVSRERGVWAAYGLHPWAASEDLRRDALESALDRPGVVAVGEVGLDSKVDGADLPRQIEMLKMQLEVARSRDLPVMLHCRGAHDALFALLALLAEANRGGGGGPLRGVIHAFSRSPELARRFIDAGLMVSFAGTITRPRARARRAAADLPLDRLLIETDAPSIALEGVLATRVEPAHTRDIAEELATIRGETLDHVAERTTENAKRLFAFE